MTKSKKIKITDLVDINFFQEFQDVFAATTNVASIAVDDSGSITKPSNFTDFCIKYTRGSEKGLKRCVDCDIHWGKVAAETGKPAIYTCHSGLTDFAVPIIVDGKHLGSILGGQVLTQKPDENHFRKIAKELEIDEEEYIQALRKIKIVPIEQVEAAANLLFFVANTISETSHKNLKLIKNEKYTRAILDSIKDGIITIDEDFIIKGCNPSVETIWGYSSSEIIGKNLDLLLDYKNNGAEGEHKVAKKISVGIKKNNEKFPVEVDISTVDFEDKKLLLLLVRDVTEYRKIEKMKNEFVSTVSHELRTPLTSIKGALGLVTSGALGVLPEKINDLIMIANNNCTRLTNLINDILDLEKIKAGKYEFLYEDLEVNSLLEQAVILNQPYADHFGMIINKVSKIDEAYIRVDKNRILQVISNLISNAVKFSNPRGKVTILAKKENNKIKISFSDKGIGIPEEAKDKIFTSFSQVDSSDSRSKGGTGLGLSICKLLVEKMGGEIGFNSKIGEGSTFFFTLPTILKSEVKELDDGKLKELNPEDDQW